MRQLPRSIDPNVLVATETADDAAVYRLNDDQAIVATVDYITPVVDDPFVYGQVAAANSLSDIWAMGARPIFALNLIGFPVDTLPHSVLAEILRGGAEKAAEAGVPIIGGHSIKDEEPKYGLAVTGIVHPERIVRNSGAQPGDVLFLTKPLGSGITSTAIKRDLASETLIASVTAVMTALNRGAGEAMVAVGASAATDVSGYGLLGHLHELTLASGMGAEISFDRIPILEGVRELAARDVVPGGSHDNLKALEETGAIDWSTRLDEGDRLVLADAQTSGGLLIAVRERQSADLARALLATGALAAQIGRIAEPDALGRIRVVG